MDLKSDIIYIDQNLIRESFSFQMSSWPLSILALISSLYLIYYCLIKSKSRVGHIFIISSLFCLSLCHFYIMPQDDLYSNFLTSYNIFNWKKLSVSRWENLEGSVDLIYYGLISLISFGKRSLIIYFSHLFSMLYLVGTSAILFKILYRSLGRESAFLGLCLCLFSQYFLRNAYCGYGYNTFLFFIFLSIYFHGEKKLTLTYLIFSLLPWIRPEGMLFVPIFIFYDTIVARKNKKEVFLKSYKYALLWVISVIGTFLFRYFFYGHWLPVTAQSKVTNFPHLPALGYALKRVYETIGPSIAVALILFLSTLVLKRKYIFKNKIITTVLSLITMGGAYKIHGGDFLFMNRYDLMLYFAVLIVTCYLFHLITVKLEKRYRYLFLSIIIGLNQFSPYSGLKSLIKTFYITKNGDNVRLFHNVGAPYKEGLSRFMNNIYNDRTLKIGVVEVNTFGFFSNHRNYDLFGTTNKDIAFTRPHPRMDLFVGYKKRNPSAMKKYNLNLIIGRIIDKKYGKVFFDELSTKDKVGFESFGWGKYIQNYELGGVKYLKSLGFYPVLLIFNNITFSILLKTNEREEFIRRIEALYKIALKESLYRYEGSDPSLDLILDDVS